MSLLSQTIRFKEIFTTNVKTIIVNPNWTLVQFIRIVTPILKNLFGFEQIEIVECGQDILGLPSELAPTLQPSNTVLKHKWGVNLNVAFYVRRKNWDYNIIENRINSDQQFSPFHQINSQNSINDCIVCLESLTTSGFFGCNHQICNSCIIGCLNNGHSRCPVCRQ